MNFEQSEHVKYSNVVSEFSFLLEEYPTKTNPYMVRGKPYMVKGKLRPRTGHEGPEEKERYSSTVALTSALD